MYKSFRLFLFLATAPGEEGASLPAVSQRFYRGGGKARRPRRRTGYKDPGPRRRLPPGAPPAPSFMRNDANGRHFTPRHPSALRLWGACGAAGRGGEAGRRPRPKEVRRRGRRPASPPLRRGGLTPSRPPAASAGPAPLPVSSAAPPSLPEPGGAGAGSDRRSLPPPLASPQWPRAPALPGGTPPPPPSSADASSPAVASAGAVAARGAAMSWGTELWVSPGSSLIVSGIRRLSLSAEAASPGGGAERPELRRPPKRFVRRWGDGHRAGGGGSGGGGGRGVEAAAGGGRALGGGGGSGSASSGVRVRARRRARPWRSRRRGEAGGGGWGRSVAASPAAVLPVTVAAGRASLCAPPALPLSLRRRAGRALSVRGGWGRRRARGVAWGGSRRGSGGGCGGGPHRAPRGRRCRAVGGGPLLSRKPPECSDELSVLSGRP